MLLDVCLSQQDQWIDRWIEMVLALAGRMSLSRSDKGWNGSMDSTKNKGRLFDMSRTVLSIVSHD